MAEVVKLGPPDEPAASTFVVDPSAFVRRDPAGNDALSLAVENMHCGGCVQRLESKLNGIDGVRGARANLTTKRLSLAWEPGRTDAVALMRAIDGLGFRALPYDPAAVQNRERAEERALLRAMAVAGFAAANVMLLSVSVWAGAFSADMGPSTRDFLHWISALIALPAVAYAGRPFFGSALTALRAGSLNMDVPISLAVVLAAGMSLFETATGGVHAYFDASVSLLFFLLIGRYLDRRARARAASAAEQMLVLGALAATVIEADGNRRILPVAALRPGMRAEVAPGDRVPADGIVLDGVSEIDTGLVTGESVPQPAKPGDEVFAGTVNLGSLLTVRIAAAGDDTLLAEIVRLMEGAEKARGRYVTLADRMARFYAPAVHVLAAAALLGWLFIGGIGWQPALLIAIAVLIVTCPCALGLAVPVVQTVASGRLFRQGVLVKSGDALERLAAVDTVVFDKTGTLTFGHPLLDNRDELDEASLRLAAGMAAGSRHPLCRALVSAAGPVAAAAVREEQGMGLSLQTAQGECRLGQRAWCGVDEAAVPDSGTEMWFARPGHAPVQFRFRDRLRGEALVTVAQLRARGLEVILLSGDRRAAVAEAAETAGIDRWYADCRPDAKVALIEELRAGGRRVAMIGDGLNDAPALRAAEVSLAPATGSDIARSAADFVLQGGDLTRAVNCIDTARRARRLMLQNFGLALAYNAVAVPLAMSGLVTPLIAALAMSSSSLAVTLNALRLRLPVRRSVP